MGNLALDASSPASVYNSTGTSATTASFTPPANSRIVVVTRYNTGTGDTPGTPTCSGGSLTYTKVADTRQGQQSPSGADGGVAIFHAVGAGASMTVTSGSAGTAATGVAVKVLVFTDDSGSTPGIGANVTYGGCASGSTSATFSANVLATATNSRGVLGVEDWQALGAPTAGTGCTVTGGDSVDQGSTLAYATVLRTSNDGVTGNNITLSGSFGGTTGSARWAAIEVTPAAGSPVDPTGLVGFPPLFWPGDGPMQVERFLMDALSTEAPGDAWAFPDTIIGFVTISVILSTGSTANGTTISPPVVTISGTISLGVAIIPATIAPPVVTISGTATTGSTVTPATIAPPVVTISGTAQGGAVAVPATIAPTKVSISGTAQAGAAPAVATIAPTKVSISGTASASSTVTPATISPVKVVISGTPALAVLITPSTIAPPTVVIGPHSAAAGSTPLPGTLAPPTVVISGSAQAGAVAAPATIAPPTVVISGTVSAGSTITVATIAPSVVVISGTFSSALAPATISPPVVVISGTATASAIIAVATISPSTVVISGSASASKTIIVSTISPPVVVIGTVVLTSAAQVVVSTITPPTVVMSPHLLKISASALVATILGLAAIPGVGFTSGYVPPGDDAKVTGDVLPPGVTGTLLPAGVTGDVLPPRITGTDITAGVD